jgi:methylated-DNA-[protein]-cysteine S-methyltransferase
MDRLRIRTPLGVDLIVSADCDAIVASDLRSRGRSGAALRSVNPLLREASAQVRAYFAHRLRRFDLPLRFVGTPLQCAVWELVSTLETGELISYGDVARAIGRPLAHRGVAAAMGRTTVDLFVPAHRVIGSDGRVKGGAGSGLRRRLLAFEGVFLR